MGVYRASWTSLQFITEFWVLFIYTKRVQYKFQRGSIQTYFENKASTSVVK